MSRIISDWGITIAYTDKSSSYRRIGSHCSPKKPTQRSESLVNGSCMRIGSQVLLKRTDSSLVTSREPVRTSACECELLTNHGAGGGTCLKYRQGNHNRSVKILSQLQAEILSDYSFPAVWSRGMAYPYGGVSFICSSLQHTAHVFMNLTRIQGNGGCFVRIWDHMANFS